MTAPPPEPRCETCNSVEAAHSGRCRHAFRHAPAPTLEREMASLINRYSQENASNTPDFILAAYLVACLDAFGKATRARENWYGKSLHI